MDNSSSHKPCNSAFYSHCPHSFLYAITEREVAFFVPWRLLPRYFFQNLCNSVSYLPSDLLSLFIYINAFSLPHFIFYLKWNKLALQLPFCFQPWFFLLFFFLLLLVCLNCMSVAMLCLLLPTLVAPCFPRALTCTLLVFLEILF